MRIFFIFIYLLILSDLARAETVAEPIFPIPAESNSATAKERLGAMLFKEKKLSKDMTISCASCHVLSMGGDDNKERSVGVGGLLGEINAPTVLNSRFNFRQFWNGRARNLSDQIDGPIAHSKEMANSWPEIISRLSKDERYNKLFKQVYASAPTKEHVKDAIVAFENRLVTPNSRFDRFLRGETNALNDQEKKGYQKFKTLGCVACHQGTNVGGNMFQTMGVMGNYFTDRGTKITDADLGRFALPPHDVQDKHVFRVPSLRNVEHTGPYFHDGSAKTLPDAVKTMAKYQLGKKLSDEDANTVALFLKTLSGDSPPILKTISYEEMP